MRTRRETGRKLADTIHQNGAENYCCSTPQAGLRSERCIRQESKTTSSGGESRSGIVKMAHKLSNMLRRKLYKKLC